MKKKIYIFAMALMLIVLTACASSRVYNFPGEFVLLSNEIPEGFELSEFTEGLEALGYEGNPGYLNEPLAFSQLYENVDSLKIANMHASLYEKPGAPNEELGIYVAEYLSNTDFRSELSKITPHENYVHLKGNKYLVMIWSDNGVYLEESNQIAEAMMERLGVERVE